MEKIRHQTSETFRLSALLALSGGFQDAYTYNVRDHVFSNAQTGNMVLMSQYFMMGKWVEALHYLFPVIAFAMGVFVAERIQQKYKYRSRIHWRQIIVALEIAILFLVGFIPVQFNMAATIFGIFFLRHAGSDFPKSSRLWLCQYHVHRKFTGGNRKSGCLSER